MSRPHRRTFARAVAVTSLLALSACGGADQTDETTEPTEATVSTPATSDPEPPEPSSSTPSPTDETNTPEQTSPPATTPTEDTEPTTPPKPAPRDNNPDDSSPKRAKAALIPAARMPGFNAQWSWDDSSTTPGAGASQPGVCLQSSLTAIGGVQEYRREFTSRLDDNSTATQISVVFPDSQTATTSAQVLAAWQSKCAAYARQSKGAKQVEVTPPATVETRVEPAQHWMVTYQPVPGDPDAGWFNAEGYVADGDTLTYLVVRTAGQDYNYPEGRTPIEWALAVAGERLVSSR